MEMKELSAIVAELMKDQAVVEEAKACKTKEDAIAFAKKHNIDASFQDIAKAVQMNLEVEGELSGEQLDAVSGGYKLGSTSDGCNICYYTS